MLRLLGLNPITSALIGAGLLAFGVGAHRTVIAAIGAAVVIWSGVSAVSGRNRRDRDRDSTGNRGR